MRISSQTVLNIFVISSLFSLYALHFTNRPPKLAYVESAKVLDSYREMQLARTQYHQHTAVWQANLDTLKNTVQREVDTYSHVRQQLSPAQRRTQEAQILQRQRQYFTYKKAISQQAAEEEARTTAEVVRKADRLMKQYGQEHGYDLVLAATEAGTVVYGREGSDITSEVIRALNK